MQILRRFYLILLAVTVINYPNPFNPKAGQSATIEAAAGATQEATLQIYDMAARLVLQKAFNLTGGAANRTAWNGYSDANVLAASGLYLYRLSDKSTGAPLAKGKIWIINK